MLEIAIPKPPFGVGAYYVITSSKYGLYKII